MLVSLANLKAYLGITNTDYDAFLTQQGETVSEAIELYCKRKLSTSNYVQTFYWDDIIKQKSMPKDSLWLAHYPVQTITSIKSVDYSGVETPLTDYRVKKVEGLLRREYNKDWFCERPKKLVVTFSAGYTAIPKPIESVVYAIIEDRYAKKLRGMSMNFGSDVQSVSIPGAVSISFDYSLQANDRESSLGMILGNHLNVLDPYRSERAVSGAIVEEWVE